MNSPCTEMLEDEDELRFTLNSYRADSMHSHRI